MPLCINLISSMAQNRYLELKNVTYWIKIAKKGISKIVDLSNTNFGEQKVNNSLKSIIPKA